MKHLIKMYAVGSSKKSLINKMYAVGSSKKSLNKMYAVGSSKKSLNKCMLWVVQRIIHTKRMM